MKTLVVAPVDPTVVTPFGPNVRQLPGLPDDELAAALQEFDPDVLIHPGPVPAEALRAWRSHRPGAVLVVLTGTAAEDGGPSQDLEIVEHDFPVLAESLEESLTVAERLWNDARVETVGTPFTGDRGRRVTLVGAGAVNLITALHLSTHGYQVTVLEAAPDPRADADWTAYGATRGGGDGRMFTLTEMDSYNDRSRTGGTPNGLLLRPVSEHGWRIAALDRLDLADRRWADEFEQIPPWLAASYNADIFQFSRRAGTIWQDLIRSTPELFDKHTGYQDGILRLYNDAEYFAWHVARNKELGAIRRVLTREEVAEQYPALEDACAGGAVAAGLEVVGFTVNVHRFVGELVGLLERLGVEFRWNSRVSGIQWAADGSADGLRTPDGLIRDSHVVLSPGAYAGELLRGIRADGEIQGMLGVWLTVPNVEPRLGHSLKIARKGHRAEESNVTLAEDKAGNAMLICGSGYGWTGRDVANIDPVELESMYDAVADTLRTYFPRGYQAAKDNGSLEASRRYCVRPWTASCLGIFESVRTTGRHRMLVTGGHNTGGFAQGPAVAEAVLAAIEGRDHDMHRRYAPGRLAAFYR